MIIVNGTIEVRQTDGSGGIDPETGYPVEGETQWGDPIPCQFIPATQDYLRKVNDEPYALLTWTILIDQVPIFTAEQIRLRRRDGEVVGEYSVVSIEQLDAVCETRLSV